MALQKTPLLHETVTNMIIEYLKKNFNSFLSDVEYQYDDGINLEPIDETSYYISDKVQTLNLPAIYVLMGEAAFQYTKDQNYMESEDSCLIIVTAEDIGAERLVRKSWRYGRVIYGILNLVDLVDTSARIKIKIIPQRLGYTEENVTGKMQKENQKFRKDAVLEVTILHYENNLTD